MGIKAIVGFAVLSPIYLLVVYLKLQLLANVLLRWNFPLSRIPGPKAMRWTHFWWIKVLSRLKTKEEMARLFKEYGKAVNSRHNQRLKSSPGF